jgi:NitT/TauT family transport system permease protein
MPRSSAGAIASRSLLEAAWPPLIAFLVTVAAWQLAVDRLQIPVYIFPSPLRIWSAFWANPLGLLAHAGITLYEAVAGFLIGSSLGAALGTLFAYSSIMARALMPYMIAANTIPTVAIAPIIIIWFGSGLSSKIAVTTFLSFFPLALNMMKGLQSYDRTIMDVFHVGAATGLQKFLKMRLPSALPYVFVGLKINVTFAVIGAIVAEFIQADRGLGFVIMTTYRTLAMPRLWAAMIVSAIMGIAFFGLVALIERMAIPWHASMREPS